MKFLPTIILTIFISQGFGQTYKTKTIIAKADSILLEAGSHLYKFFTYDPKTYYEYEKNGKLKWKTLNKKVQTKGRFKKSYVRFHFRHPDYPWIQL